VLKDEGPPLSMAFRVMSLAIPGLFVIVVFASIVLWAFKKGFTEFDQFKILVGLIEGGFGVYVGQFIYALFKKKADGTSSV
jgi:hypothetical protein